MVSVPKLGIGVYGQATRVPAIPDTRTAKLGDVVEVVKEWIEVREGTRGDGLDRAVTLRDLLNSGLATPFDLTGMRPGTPPPIGLSPGNTDPDIPPTPENLVAIGAFRNVILSWDFARGYSRLAYFEIWRSLTDVIGEAVLIAQTFGVLYADEIGPGKSYYYWVRAVSDAPATSPFNAFSGTVGATAMDPGYLIGLLEGQITATELHQDLGGRIDLIDGPESQAGSVAARVKAETDARVVAINQEIDARIEALRKEAEAREAYVQGYTYSKVEVNTALAIQAIQIRAAYETYADEAETAAITTAAADVRNYAYSKSTVDMAEAAQTNSLTTAYKSYADGKKDEALTAAAADVRNYAYSKAGTDGAISSMAATLRSEFSASGNATQSYVQNYTYSKAEFDQAQAGQNNTLTTAYQNYATTKKDEAIQAASSDVRNYAYSKAGTDGAIASATSTLSTTVGEHTTSIQSHTASINGLSGQFTFKIDNNGYVTGFGLASTLTNAVPYSAFIVRSDSFAIASPEGPGVAPALPFIVRTTPTVINGVAVPVGVYIRDTFIQNGSIGTALIGNLAVDDAKIANMSVAKLRAGKLAVSEYIESTNYAAGDTGFRIHGNGNSEFSNVTVRGTVYATAGHIGDILISPGNGIYSSNWGSTTGFHISSSGVATFNQAIIRGTLLAGTVAAGSLSTLNATIGTLRTADSGARIEISDNLIEGFASNNVRRFRLSGA